MAQLFETLCMMLAFKESHSLAVHYCRLVWDVRSLSKLPLQSLHIQPLTTSKYSPSSKLQTNKRTKASSSHLRVENLRF